MTTQAPITLEALNNPGAVPKASPLQWQGTATAAASTSLEAFEHPRFGIRTIARALVILQDARKTGDDNRLAQVMSTVQNWTKAIGPELKAIGFDRSLDVTDYATARRLVEKVITAELGHQPYAEGVLNRGLHLAGIEQPDLPDPGRWTWRTFTGKLAAVLGTVSVAGIGADLLVWVDILSPLSDVLPWADNLPKILAAVSAVLFWYSKKAALARGVA